MAAKPYYTSNDIVDAIKRKISFPLAQNTFTYDDILAFVNEEMQISQVPSVLQFHQDYFVYNQQVPLVPNTSRYVIPDRAIGMRLRDLAWSDISGNLYEMTRVDSDDKTFFQRNIGANQSIHKFYLEGNDVVLTPSVIGDPTGNLNFFIFLRPNQLVRNNRAAVIQSYSKDYTFDNSALVAGDQIILQLGNNTPTPVTTVLLSSDKTLVGSAAGSPTVITTTLPHGMTVASTFKVYISECTESTVNGVFTATATGANTFTIPVLTASPGTGGNLAFLNEYSIGSSSIQTALNFSNTVNDTFPNKVTALNNSTPTSRITFTDFSLTSQLVVSVSTSIVTDNTIILVNFDQLPTTFTNPDTNLSENLFQINSPVDFLQTKPGHRTYKYDVTLVNISGATGTFNINELMLYSSTGNGQVLVPINLQIGDYVCLANECVIPQIPPDLHNGLAERASARILAAIGDTAGLQATTAKIAEIEQRQGNLLDQRVDGSPMKVTSRHSLLRYGKMGSNRRF